MRTRAITMTEQAGGHRDPAARDALGTPEAVRAGRLGDYAERILQAPHGTAGARR